MSYGFKIANPTGKFITQSNLESYKIMDSYTIPVPTNGYEIELGDITELSSATKFTVAFWFYNRGVYLGDMGGIIAKEIFLHDADNGYIRIYLYVPNAAEIRFQFSGDSIYNNTNLTTLNNSWIHCICQYDSSLGSDKAQIYINNIDDTQHSVDSNQNYTGNSTNTICSTIYDTTTQLILRDFRILNDILTSDERDFIYNSGEGTYETDDGGSLESKHILHLPMNETEGTTVYDSLGNYDGTVSGDLTNLHIIKNSKSGLIFDGSIGKQIIEGFNKNNTLLFIPTTVIAESNPLFSSAYSPYKVVKESYGFSWYMNSLCYILETRVLVMSK